MCACRTRLRAAMVVAALALASSLASLPAAAMTFATIEVRCPVSSGPLPKNAHDWRARLPARTRNDWFESEKVASLTSPGQASDILPIQPGRLLMHECPRNGFIMYKKTFALEELARLRPFVASSLYAWLRRHHNFHYRTAQLQIYMGENEGVIAESLLAGERCRSLRTQGVDLHRTNSRGRWTRMSELYGKSEPPTWSVAWVGSSAPVLASTEWCPTLAGARR